MDHRESTLCPAVDDSIDGFHVVTDAITRSHAFCCYIELGVRLVAFVLQLTVDVFRLVKLLAERCLRLLDRRLQVFIFRQRFLFTTPVGRTQ